VSFGALLTEILPPTAEMALREVPVCISLSAVNMAGLSLRDIHVATASEAECRQWLTVNALLANLVIYSFKGGV